MKNVAEMIDEYIQETGLARIEFRPTDGVGVVFLDEDEFIPFWDLAYNGKLGFFRASAFPEQEREAGYVVPVLKYLLARIKSFDGKEEYFNYAIVPDDYGLTPFIVGERASVELLAQMLTRFLETGEVAFDLDDADYDDLHTWVDVGNAAKRVNINIETLRKAAKRGANGEPTGIPGAKKDGSRWVVPLAGLKQWMKDRPKRGPAGKK